MTEISKENKKNTKKKKKCGCLGFLIKVAILVICVIVGFKLMNHFAEKDLNNFIVSYPFELTNETNNLNYVTDNFTVRTKYQFNEKEYVVTWKSNDDCVSFDENGNATVTRPQSSNKSITLTKRRAQAFFFR